MTLYFPLSSHVPLVLYNPLCLGNHYFCSALPGEAPCADRQPLRSHLTKNFHAYSTEKPWSPEIMQLIKSVCFSTFPKTYFAFHERREEFPWNLPSSEQTGSLQAQGCYASFTTFLLLTVILSNAKQGLFKH